MDPNCSNRHLINKLDREQLDARLAQENFKRITLSFYRYVIILNNYKSTHTIKNRFIIIQHLSLLLKFHFSQKSSKTSAR